LPSKDGAGEPKQRKTTIISYTKYYGNRGSNKTITEAFPKTNLKPLPVDPISITVKKKAEKEKVEKSGGRE